MYSTTISSQGQIALPKKVRQLLGLAAGSRLTYDVHPENGTITLKKQAGIDEISTHLNSLIKPGTPPLTNPSDFYQTREPRL